MTSEKPDERPRPAASEANFQTTCWSLVLDLDASDPGRSRAALEELCRAYWPPLYAFARRRGFPPHDAQDLVQGFFLALCAEDDFRKYVRNPGARFRTWLLSCLRHFEIDAWRKQQTLKRGAQIQRVSLDLEDESGRAAYEIPGSTDPDTAFDAALARRVCQLTFLRLEAEQEKVGMRDLYLALKDGLLGGGAISAMTEYRELADRLGMTVDAVVKRGERLRRRFAELLREEVGRLVPSPAEVDDELRHLLRALA